MRIFIAISQFSLKASSVEMIWTEKLIDVILNRIAAYIERSLALQRKQGSRDTSRVLAWTRASSRCLLLSIKIVGYLPTIYDLKRLFCERPEVEFLKFTNQVIVSIGILKPWLFIFILSNACLLL